MFGLIDCNNFFVSCERVFNPSLCGKPVLVLSSNDGCVISRSNEAKALNIPMGIPVFKIRQEIERHKIVTLSCNHTLYGDMSRRVMSLLSQEVPKLEIYSIDESFLDLNDISGDPEAFGRKLVAKIFRCTGIPVSLGIASTKTLAKLASHHAKKHPETKGVFRWGEEDILLMHHLPVNEIWGIGRRYTKMLEANGKHTVYDFYNSSRSWIKRFMTIQGERTWLELHGESCLSLEEVDEPQRSICTSRSFGEPVTHLSVMEEIIAKFVASCALKLRNQGSFASALQVFIYTNRFDSVNFYNGNLNTRFVSPINNTPDLTGYAIECLHKIFRPGLRYKKAGVILYNISEPQAIQGDLFSKADTEKQQKLQAAIDTINRRIGKEKIRLAIQGNGMNWTLKRDFLSPDYTTDLNDIFTIHV